MYLHTSPNKDENMAYRYHAGSLTVEKRSRAESAQVSAASTTHNPSRPSPTATVVAISTLPFGVVYRCLLSQSSQVNRCPCQGFCEGATRVLGGKRPARKNLGSENSFQGGHRSSALNFCAATAVNILYLVLEEAKLERGRL